MLWVLIVQCSVLFCLYARVLSPLTCRQSNAGGRLAPTPARRMANICQHRSFPTLDNFQTGEVCNMIFEEKTTYTDFSYWFQVCMHVHNNGSRGRYDFSQLPLFPSVFRAKRLKEEFAKTFPDKRAAGPLAGWALSHTFCRSVIGLRALPPWHSPTTGEKFENHQTAKWSKWPTICPAELIWVVYLSRNV